MQRRFKQTIRPLLIINPADCGDGRDLSRCGPAGSGQLMSLCTFIKNSGGCHLHESIIIGPMEHLSCRGI
jgi:hypothetical protein